MKSEAVELKFMLRNKCVAGWQWDFVKINGVDKEIRFSLTLLWGGSPIQICYS
jgi:hypothetical protein